MPAIQPVLRGVRAATALVVLAAAAACGGGGGGGGSGGGGTEGGQYIGLEPLFDGGRGRSLSTPNETTSVTHHTLTLGGTAIAYTATAGHMTALDSTQAAEASIFYVAYTADASPPATRPVTFFFNGGPGSATAWLHLGSFAPKRLSTGIPATTQALPFPYVDNTESLIDTSDLCLRRCGGHRAVGGHRAAHQSERTGAWTPTPRCCATSSPAGSPSTAAPSRRCSSTASPTARCACRCSRACSRPPAPA